MAYRIFIDGEEIMSLLRILEIACFAIDTKSA